jgi:hypothetical protein
MKLSKKSKRGIAQFNHLKYNTSKVMYSLKQPKSTLDLVLNAYKEVKNAEKKNLS